MKLKNIFLFIVIVILALPLKRSWASFPHPSDLSTDSFAAVWLLYDNSGSMLEGVQEYFTRRERFGFLGQAEGSPGRIGRHAAVYQTLVGDLRCRIEKTSSTPTMFGGGISGTNPYKLGEGRLDFTHGNHSAQGTGDYLLRSFWVKVVSADKNGKPTDYTEFDIVPVPISFSTHVSNTPHLHKGVGEPWRHMYPFGDETVSRASHGVHPQFPYGFINGRSGPNGGYVANPGEYTYSYTDGSGNPVSGTDNFPDASGEAGKEDYYYFMPYKDPATGKGASVNCWPRDPTHPTQGGLLNRPWAKSIDWSFFAMDGFLRHGGTNGGVEKVALGATRETFADPAHPNYDSHTSSPIIRNSNVEAVIDSLLSTPSYAGVRQPLQMYGTPTQGLLLDVKESIKSWYSAHNIGPGNQKATCTAPHAVLLTDGEANLDVGEQGHDTCSPYYQSSGYATPKPMCVDHPDRIAKSINLLPEVSAAGVDGVKIHVINMATSSNDQWNAPAGAAYNDPDADWVRVSASEPSNSINAAQELNKRIADLTGGQFAQVSQPQDIMTALQEIFAEILGNKKAVSGPVAMTTGVFSAVIEYDISTASNPHGDIRYNRFDASGVLVVNANPPSANKAMEIEDANAGFSEPKNWYTNTNRSDSNYRDDFSPDNASLLTTTLNLGSLDSLSDVNQDGSNNDSDVDSVIRYVRANGAHNGTGERNIAGTRRSHYLDAIQTNILRPSFQANRFNQSGYFNFFANVLFGHEVILTVTDDGIFHCFDAREPTIDPPGPGDTLDRISSFVPYLLLPHLKNLRQVVHDHMNYVSPLAVDKRKSDGSGEWERVALVNVLGNASFPGGISEIQIADQGVPGAHSCTNPQEIKTYQNPSDPITYPMIHPALINLGLNVVNNPGNSVHLLTMFDRMSDRIQIYNMAENNPAPLPIVNLRPVDSTANNLNGLVNPDTSDAGWTGAEAYDRNGDGGTDLIIAVNHFGLIYGIQVNITDAANITGSDFDMFLIYDPLNPNANNVNSKLDFGSRDCDQGANVCTAADKKPVFNNGSPLLYRAGALGNDRLFIGYDSDFHAPILDETEGQIHQIQLAASNKLISSPFGRGTEITTGFPINLKTAVGTVGTPKTVWDMVVLDGTLFALAKNKDVPNDCELGGLFLYAIDTGSGVLENVFFDETTGQSSSSVEIADSTNTTITLGVDGISYSFINASGDIDYGQVSIPGYLEFGIKHSFVF